MQTPETAPKTARILSIDAWRDIDGGWRWNNWHSVGSCPVETADFSTRKLLAYLRRERYLSPLSAGRVAVEDDGYNVVVTDRGTGESLLAIEYGACY